MITQINAEFTTGIFDREVRDFICDHLRNLRETTGFPQITRILAEYTTGTIALGVGKDSICAHLRNLREKKGVPLILTEFTTGTFVWEDGDFICDHLRNLREKMVSH